MKSPMTTAHWDILELSSSQVSDVMSSYYQFPHSIVAAALQEEFSLQPSDVEVAEGEGAVLHCGPPVGHPEPNVRWKKDGLPIDYTDPHFTVSPAPSVPV